MMGAMRVETIGCFHITMSAPKDVCWSIVMDNAEWLTGYTLMRAIPWGEPTNGRKLWLLEKGKPYVR